MSPGTQIRQAVNAVAGLRLVQAANPDLQSAVLSIKRLQAQRFRGSHLDLLEDKRYSAASRFFLDELYSEKDYTRRDAQFVRMAGALERFFPSRVIQTAVVMSALHELTEQLDDAMAHAWMRHSAASEYSLRYALAWRTVGKRASRERQLAQVLQLGADLDQLTKTTGLRLTLRMMRKPAAASGLAELQGFLERGFDAFIAMDGAVTFLKTIEKREAQWVTTLSDAPLDECTHALAAVLQGSN